MLFYHSIIYFQNSLKKFSLFWSEKSVCLFWYQSIISIIFNNIKSSPIFQLLDIILSVDPEDEEPDIESDEFEFDFQIVADYTKDEYSVDGGANAGFDKKGNPSINSGRISTVLSISIKPPLRFETL